MTSIVSTYSGSNPTIVVPADSNKYMIVCLGIAYREATGTGIPSWIYPSITAPDWTISRNGESLSDSVINASNIQFNWHGASAATQRNYRLKAMVLNDASSGSYSASVSFSPTATASVFSWFVLSGMGDSPTIDAISMTGSRVYRVSSINPTTDDSFFGAIDMVWVVDSAVDWPEGGTPGFAFADDYSPSTNTDFNLGGVYGLSVNSGSQSVAFTHPGSISGYTTTGSAGYSMLITPQADPPPATDFYVDPDATESGDGTSWDSPFKTLQEANNLVTQDAGDRIFIKAGIIDNINAEIVPLGGVSWYGGFNKSLTGTSAVIEDRKPFVDKTIIQMSDANYSTSYFGCVGEGTPGDDNDVHIDGIHFYDCYNDSATTARRGGAIRINSNDNWEITNCKFLRCGVGSTGRGGAICAATADSVGIWNCVFEDCTGDTTSYGGAICLYDSNGFIVQCSFKTCGATNGGAVDIYRTLDASSGILIQDCIFDACYASTKGDSIYEYSAFATVTIQWCDLINGNGPDTSCALYVYNDNTGISTNVNNTVIAWTEGDGYQNGGATYDKTVFTNCTIAKNGGYGVAFSTGASRTVYAYNSIIWDNTDGSTSATLTECTYSDVEGGHTGTGNINVDPIFRGANDSLPFALNSATECVDGGSASVTGYVARDRTGYTRVDTPDMGAIEFIGIIWPPGAIDTSYYRLQLHGIVQTADFPINFVFPFLTAATTEDTMGWSDADVIRNELAANDCYPLRFGGQHRKDSSTSFFLEKFKATLSKQTLTRFNNVHSDTPTWACAFNDEDQSYDYAYIGTNSMLTTGKKFEGILKKQINQPLVELIRYAAQHSNNSLLDEMYVYNLWVENYPETTRDDEPCALWIGEHASVSDPDFPVSSGLMIELIRILNKITWEMRGPMSVPVFGKYLVYVPPAPVE